MTNFYPGSRSSVNSTFEDAIKAIDKVEQAMSDNLAMVEWLNRKVETTAEAINQMVAGNSAQCTPYVTEEVIEYQRDMMEQSIEFREDIVQRFTELNTKLAKLDELRAMVNEAMAKLLPVKSETSDSQ